MRAVDKLHPYYSDVTSAEDLPQIVRDQIGHFASIIKTLKAENGQGARLGRREKAREMIEAAIARAQK